MGCFLPLCGHASSCNDFTFSSSRPSILVEGERQDFICQIETAGHRIVELEQTRSGVDLVEYKLTLQLAGRDDTTEIDFIGPVVRIIGVEDSDGSVRPLQGNREHSELVRILLSGSTKAGLLAEDFSSSEDVWLGLANPYFFSLAANDELQYISLNASLPFSYLYLSVYSSTKSACIEDGAEFKVLTTTTTSRRLGLLVPEAVNASTIETIVKTKPEFAEYFTALAVAVEENFPVFLYDVSRYRPVQPTAGAPPELFKYDTLKLIREIRLLLSHYDCGSATLHRIERGILSTLKQI